MLLALKRLLLQGALRVALVAITTAGVMGFLSLVAASSQAPELTLASSKEPSGACMPSRCRADAQLSPNLAVRFNGPLERNQVHAADARKGRWV